MKKIISTPHIIANENEFGENLLVSGDPKRIEYIASHFLKKARLITSVRGMLGFVGYYHGVKIGLMAHGMGMPSMAIYITELIRDWHVKNIIRVGTCGALNQDLRLRDVIVGKQAFTDSNILDHLRLYNTNASSKLLRHAKTYDVKPVNIFTSDLFYSPKGYTPNLPQVCDVVEMETAVLYGIANKYKVNALSVCTVSDYANGKKGQLTPKERQEGVDESIKIALDILVKNKKINKK